jgi:hypothetical protein
MRRHIKHILLNCSTREERKRVSVGIAKTLRHANKCKAPCHGWDVDRGLLARISGRSLAESHLPSKQRFAFATEPYSAFSAMVEARKRSPSPVGDWGEGLGRPSDRANRFGGRYIDRALTTLVRAVRTVAWEPF